MMMIMMMIEPCSVIVYFSVKTYAVTPHYNCLTETILMWDHNTFLSVFSSDFKSEVPDSYFWAGTPSFQKNLTKLYSGTPTFLKKCPLDSYFENPRDSPVYAEIQTRIPWN